MTYRKIDGESSLLRIYVSDFDRAEHHSLHKLIVEKARERGLAGCTAFIGYWGYGARGFIHTDLALEGAGERPILIEIVDTKDRTESFAKEISPLMKKAGGLITSEKVFVHHYQHESTGVAPGKQTAEEEQEMAKELSGQNVLLRVFIGENDKFGNKPLFEAILIKSKELGMAGGTVIRGILGYGASSVIHHGHVFRLSQDLPMVVEVIDSADKIARLLDEIRPMLQGALVTEEKVQVHHYAAKNA